MAHDRIELREKVEVRTKALNAALAKEQSDKLPDERIVALRSELSVVEAALSGGWDNVSEVTAAQLASWLESSRNLVDSKPKAVAGKAVNKASDKASDKAIESHKVGASAGSPRAEDHDPQRQVVTVRPSPKSPDLSNPTRSAGDFDNPSGVAPNGTRQ